MDRSKGQYFCHVLEKTQHTKTSAICGNHSALLSFHFHFPVLFCLFSWALCWGELPCVCTMRVLWSHAPDRDVQLGTCSKCVHDFTMAAQQSWVKRPLCVSNAGCASLLPTFIFLWNLPQFRPLVLSHGAAYHISIKKNEHLKLRRKWKKIKAIKKCISWKGLEITSTLPAKSHFEPTRDLMTHI